MIRGRMVLLVSGTRTKLWCRIVVILSAAKNLVLGAGWRPFAQFTLEQSEGLRVT